MKKTLLIISGGVEALPGIKLAKEMGLHVVVSDINPQAPGILIADDHIIESTYDVEKTKEAVIKYNKDRRSIDGVMCIASDVPLTVATISQTLNLPGISVESAILATDKLVMKYRFKSDNIAIPWFKPVTSEKELNKIIREKGYPLVLKPVDSRGARGVLRLTEDIDSEWAYNFSLKNSPSGRVMVEEFLEGPQVSTESLVIEGKVYTPGFSDRNYEFLEKYAPSIIENGGDLPSHLNSEIQKSVTELLGKAASSMGITNGVIKGDIVIHKGKPCVIELAARLSGGYFCTHEIPLNTGVNFVKQAILMSLGEKIDIADLTPRFQKHVSQRYIFPEPGKVISITGEKDVMKRKGIALCEVRVSIGDVIGEINCHPARAGVIIATGNTREEAMERAVNAVKDIKIETE